MAAGRIIVVGLGPGDPALRSLAAQQALDGASRILLRTRIHPGLDAFAADPRVSSCDDLYETGADFDAVYAAIVERVLTESEAGDIVFAVPGSPTQGERTVQALRERLAATPERLAIVPSVGALDVIASDLGFDLMAADVQLIDATTLAAFVEGEPFSGGTPDCSPTRPLLVSQLYSQPIASAVKLALGRLYPDEHPVVIVRSAGVAGHTSTTTRPLYEIDRHPVDHLTSLWVPPLDPILASRAANTIYAIAARLRAPGGCPWDRAQTHASIRSAVVEEAYEVVDAIDEADPTHLAEELGDLLIQVALHSQMAEEAGDFTVADVFEAVNTKLVRRHPHVFGDLAAASVDDVRSTWADVKAAERKAKGITEAAPTDPFDKLPKAMPTLDKLADVLPAGSTLEATEIDRLADEAYVMIARLIAGGGDPRRELERAYRRSQAAAHPETKEANL